MRRKDREVRDPEFFREVFQASEVLTVAFNDGEYPYSVPLSYAVHEGSIYFHCALEGKKLDCIARDPHVHFTAFDYVGVDGKRSTAHYRSVFGTGIAEVVADDASKVEALKLLMARYSTGCDVPADTWCARTCVVRIRITSLSGKQHLAPKEG